MGTNPFKMKIRYENFGAIISNESPAFLAFADRQYVKELGLGDSPLWEDSDTAIGFLSAPTEVHVSITNRCSNACPHCYMDSGEPDPCEMDTELFKRALKSLADMGVFHVALGGGEALERPDLFEIAAYCREIGLVPNLTTSGSIISPTLAKQMAVFGQVNFSLDGVGELSGIYRGREVFDEVDHALKRLREAGVPAGLNCVVGRGNFDGLQDLLAYAKEASVNEVELLRFKPAGRGTLPYEAEKTTYEQNIKLIPLLQTLQEESGVRIRIDCSFVPMLAWHNPPIELLEAHGTYGCEAGNVLMAARSNGHVAGCSFLPDTSESLFQLAETWDKDPEYGSLRTWRDRAVEPCRSCNYLRICNGGCHAVALAVTGDVQAADPDCPTVHEYRSQSPA